MSLPPVGCQLLVFGGHLDIETQTDLILDSLVEAGYAAVEGGPADAALYRQKLDARGLRYGGSHVTLPALRDLPPLISYLQTLGSADICNSGRRGARSSTNSTIFAGSSSSSTRSVQAGKIGSNASTAAAAVPELRNTPTGNP